MRGGAIGMEPGKGTFKRGKAEFEKRRKNKDVSLRSFEVLIADETKELKGEHHSPLRFQLRSAKSIKRKKGKKKRKGRG